MDLTIAILTGTIIAATPLLMAALGELIVEKSGVLNLGIEGMMLLGAAVAFWAAAQGFGLPVAFMAGALAGMAGAAVFALLALGFLANQTAAGLALTIFGTGISAMIGMGFGSQPVVTLGALHLPLLSDIPVIGALVFSYDILVYATLALVPVTWWWLNRTKAGLILRAVGENPENAFAIGYDVIKIRLLAILYGGALAGLAGAYLSVAFVGIWVENMTAGRGWIALSLVVFAAWRPWRALAGAILFGGFTILQLHGQILGLPLPPEAMSALPYLATIVVLVLISRGGRLRDVPQSLARPFRSGS